MDKTTEMIILKVLYYLLDDKTDYDSILAKKELLKELKSIINKKEHMI